MAGDLDQVVGVRFSRREPLVWYRAGDVPAGVGSWVMAGRDGGEAVGEVIVGLGQCLGFPGEARMLPTLIRVAREGEAPRPLRGAGRALLDALP